jgi:Rdx family protein
VAELNGTGHTAEMRAGETSQYDVLADDALIFSKQREGRFPEIAEIIAALT